MTVMNLDKLDIWVRAKDFARGSLTEVQSHMTLAHELGYLPDGIFDRFTSHAESIGKQLNSYIAYLKRSKQGEKDFPAGYIVREDFSPYVLDDSDQDFSAH